MHIDISVVITTYNRLETTKRAIKSALNQTYSANEIIVVEDGSNSGIEDWIKVNFAGVRYIRNIRNIGLAGSRNVGMQESRGNWIAFLDDDDIWLPRRLECQADAILNSRREVIEKVGCVQVGNKTVNKNGKLLHTQIPTNSGCLYKDIKYNGINTPSSTFLFQKKILQDIGGFSTDLISGIDHDIMMKLAQFNYHSISVKQVQVCVYYSLRDTMMTNINKRMKGIKYYLLKWSPLYEEWYGLEGANKFKKFYYTIVISRLLKTSIKKFDFINSFRILTDILSYNDYNILNILRFYLNRKTYQKKII